MDVKGEPVLPPDGSTGCRAKEDEDSLQVFSILCRHNDIILVVSALGWQCKKCDVNFDFSSGESLESHLHHSHEIDTRQPGSSKRTSQPLEAAKESQKMAETTHRISSQTKGSEKNALILKESGDTTGSASSTVNSHSAYGRRRKRTYKAMEAENFPSSSLKKSKKSSVGDVADISLSKQTASHEGVARADEELQASSEMQPLVVLTRMDNELSSEQIGTVPSSKLVQKAEAKKDETNKVKKVHTKLENKTPGNTEEEEKKKNKTPSKANLQAKLKAKKISSCDDSKHVNEVSRLHDKYVSKLNSQTAVSESVEDDFTPQAGAKGQVQISALSQDVTTSLQFQNGTVSADDLRPKLTRESELVDGQTVVEMVVKESTNMAPKLSKEGHATPSTLQCLNPQDGDACLGEEHPHNASCTDTVAESSLRALDLSAEAVDTGHEFDHTAIPDSDSHVTVDTETVGSIITITLPVKLESSDQGDVALLVEDQNVGSNITIVDGIVVPSADPGSAVVCAVTEPVWTSEDCPAEAAPTEAVLCSVQMPPSPIETVGNSGDLHQEDQHTEVASVANSSANSAKNNTTVTAVTTVCSASKEKGDSIAEDQGCGNGAIYRLRNHLGSTPALRRLFECDFCHHPFVDAQSVQAHIKHYQDQQPVRCKTCQEKFHNIDLLNLHIFSEHEKEANPFCLTCKKRYLNKRSFTEHLVKFHPACKGLSAVQLHLDSLGTEQCRVCGINIRRDPKLVDLHYEAHSKTDFSCRVCGKWFQRRFLVYAHFQLEHNQKADGKEFSSELNEEELNKIRNLLEEENASRLGNAQDQEPPQSFSCKVCHKDLLDTRRGILKHLMKHYEPPSSMQVVYSTYKCPDCGEEIPDKGQNISYHRLTHGHVDSDNIKLKCSVCTAIFHSEGTVKRHERSVHKFDRHKLSRTFICEVCGRKFAGPVALAKHVELHSEEKGLFSCDVCGKGFFFKSQMETHQAKHKSKSGLLNCPHCDKVYMAKASVNRHIQVVHMGVTDYQYKCHLCPAQFYASVRLRDHVATKHEGKRPYSCHLCAQTFVCQTTLSRHLRRDHEGHNPFVCKTCGEKFTEKHRLARHEARHKGLELFACSVCHKSFSTNFTLRNHMNMHRGIRPVLCEDCGMGFCSKSNLARHRSSKSCTLNKQGAVGRYKVQVVENESVGAFS